MSKPKPFESSRREISSADVAEELDPIVREKVEALLGRSLGSVAVTRVLPFRSSSPETIDEDIERYRESREECGVQAQRIKTAMDKASGGFIA